MSWSSASATSCVTPTMRGRADRTDRPTVSSWPSWSKSPTAPTPRPTCRAAIYGGHYGEDPPGSRNYGVGLYQPSHPKPAPAEAPFLPPGVGVRVDLAEGMAERLDASLNSQANSKVRPEPVPQATEPVSRHELHFPRAGERSLRARLRQGGYRHPVRAHRVPGWLQARAGHGNTLAKCQVYGTIICTQEGIRECRVTCVAV